MSQFLMPSLGADMEAGTLVEKLRNPGECVARGDVIAAVETQKGVIEIEVFEDGVLQEWLVDLGTKVDVGTPLAMIQTDHDAATASSASDPPNLPEPQAPEPPNPEAPQPQDPQPNVVPPEEPERQIPEPEIPGPEIPIPEVPQPDIQPLETGYIALQERRVGDKKRLRITPSARRLAAQRGIDLGTLSRQTDAPIYLQDIAALTQTSDAPQPSDMRAAIAAAMSRSKREIPHYYLSHSADLTNADEFVSATNATRAPEARLMLGVLYLKAIARAVKKFPEFNGHFKDDNFDHSEASHVGLAISLRGGGLVAPAVFDADAQGLDDVMTAMRNLITRVRTGRFRARELTDATITLTSLGERGVDQLYGVIYPPQVAIVGIGTPALTAQVQGEACVPRLTATITLAADHRVSDGRRGALFLQEIVKHLQNPETL